MLLSIVIGLLLTAGCGQKSYNEQQELFLANNGWSIKKLMEVETYMLDIPNEMLSNYEASGITFLEDYLGKEVTECLFVLKEKDRNGENLKAVVFETEEEIIGGYGILPSWTPGLFNLGDKERLINEQMIKQ